MNIDLGSSASVAVQYLGLRSPLIFVLTEELFMTNKNEKLLYFQIKCLLNTLLQWDEEIKKDYLWRSFVKNMIHKVTFYNLYHKELIKTLNFPS